MITSVKIEAFMARFWRKATSLQPIAPNVHLSTIKASITKTGMQNAVIRMFARLRLRTEKLVELRRIPLWRIIAKDRMLFPMKEATKIRKKKKIMATLLPTENWHFTEPQTGMVEFEAFRCVAFIMRLAFHEKIKVLKAYKNRSNWRNPSVLINKISSKNVRFIGIYAC